MTQIAFSFQNPIYFDVVSEPSTEGDDIPTYDTCPQPLKKKNIAKNKMKSSLCKNFS